MKPMGSAQITGTWGAVLLPLNSDDSIDFGALAEEVDALLESGLAGIYTNGTAGEFHAQREEEFDQLSVLVAERCRRRGVPFQLGVCHMSAQHSRERLRRVKGLAPGAVQVILPDWVPVSPTEMEGFLTEMAEMAHPIGLVLYSPAHSKRPLGPAAVARLRGCVRGLVGVKMPDGNASWYSGMRHHLRDFSVFVPGHHLASGRALGAAGSYSNVACLSPRGAQAWYELMERDPPAALEFENRLLAFFQQQVSPLGAQGYCSAAIDKALAAAGGWCGMSPKIRWPYRSVSVDTVALLGEAARRMLPELWSAR
jgi:4-hydroxy-tetrahydrodipicolinate synthase